MYHGISNVVKPFFDCGLTGGTVDNLCPLAYSVHRARSVILRMFLRTLLDRYIFTELLSPFSVSLGALCFVMLTRERLR